MTKLITFISSLIASLIYTFTAFFLTTIINNHNFVYIVNNSIWISFFVFPIFFSYFANKNKNRKLTDYILYYSISFAGCIIPSAIVLLFVLAFLSLMAGVIKGIT